jgi:hypothetical protein
MLNLVYYVIVDIVLIVAVMSLLEKLSFRKESLSLNQEIISENYHDESTVT